MCNPALSTPRNRRLRTFRRVATDPVPPAAFDPARPHLAQPRTPRQFAFAQAAIAPPRWDRVHTSSRIAPSPSRPLTSASTPRKRWPPNAFRPSSTSRDRSARSASRATHRRPAPCPTRCAPRAVRAWQPAASTACRCRQWCSPRWASCGGCGSWLPVYTPAAALAATLRSRRGLRRYHTNLDGLTKQAISVTINP